MAERVCQVCGEGYRGKPGSPYCSLPCAGRAKSIAADQERSGAIRVCVQCGKPYTPRYGQWAAFKASKFCSHECANHGKQRTIDMLAKQIVTDPVTGCHVWTGHKTSFGYGHVRFNGTRTVVHRLIWEHLNGPVPEGLQLDHICRNTACCNPKHLRPVTAQVNVLYGNNLCAQNARKSVCPKCGGPYTVRPDATRYCRSCTQARQAEKVRMRWADDSEFRERSAAASKRYYDKRSTDPQSVGITGRGRRKNSSCPKCGSDYSTWPNGGRYCKPCRDAGMAALAAKRKGD